MFINVFHLDGSDHTFGLSRISRAGPLEYSTAKEGKSGFMEGVTDFGALSVGVESGGGIGEDMFIKIERIVDSFNIFGKDEFMILGG